MTQAKIGVVGMGDLGGRIAQLGMALAPVVGMRRGSGAPHGVSLIRHDASTPWPALDDQPELAMVADWVLCLSPGGRTVDAYRQAYTQVAEQALSWLQKVAPQAHVWLISSTSVYGEAQGDWVDEATITQPETPTAKVLVEAEQLWLTSPQPCTILRPAGLYGPGREYMFRQAREGFQIADADPIYTNRIHIDDAARAVVHLLKRRRTGERIADCYNLTDNAPAALQEVLHWLHQRLGITPHESRQLERSSKRIAAQRLADTGFTWHYPSFREGYSMMLETE